ncbi:hypothetical protein I6M64_05475 [Acinetobacter lactucae]|uniref:Uncharacterized protein n=1 Tax=Acinetobacter lactucae TaxID=1785128 RepID=A0ABS1AFQ9_9GAMM|nr:hypothetical protein [Acinetobacter lactucae]MBJ8436774.1 hypothetical protein [Acinetobacter lactucae]
MKRSTYMFTKELIAEVREEMTKSSFSDYRTVVNKSIPKQTADYVNKIHLSREEMNEAFAKARAFGKTA